MLAGSVSLVAVPPSPSLSLIQKEDSTPGIDLWETDIEWTPEHGNDLGTDMTNKNQRWDNLG